MTHLRPAIFGRGPRLGKPLLAAALLAPALATAGPNDIRLPGLAQGFTPAQDGDDPTPLAQDPAFQARFAALTRQLGVVLAPTALTPAETLGANGFALYAETSFTGVDLDSNGPENYWVLGTEESNPTGVQSLLSLRVRKGFPGSIEVGAGLSSLAGSRLTAGQVDVKLSLTEGFQTLYFLPDLSIRLGGARLLGAPDLDLTTVSAGAMLSKPFGLGGVLSLTPYFAYEELVTIGLSQVVDFTPGTTDDFRNNDVFGDAYLRGARYAGGLRLISGRASAAIALSVTPDTDGPARDTTPFDTSDDTGPSISSLLGGPVAGQRSFQLALGLDF